MSREMELNSGPLQEREVAIVGASPVGLMTANLLGLAGIRVVAQEQPIETRARLTGLTKDEATGGLPLWVSPPATQKFSSPRMACI